jgi:DNA-binding CsgD family transcriptional regulator
VARRNSRPGARFGAATEPQIGPRLGAPLSMRQQQILALIAAGKSNKEIADRLGLATGTVKQHAYALFRKLGVRNRTMAAARGAQVAPTQAEGAAAGDAETRAEAEPRAPADAVRYARRLVTAVVIEPRPAPVRTSREAMQIERRVGALRGRAGRLALAFDAVPELLSGGGIAAWFGQPVAHGDDAERAVAFVRALGAAAAAEDSLPVAIGIGTVAEIVGEGQHGSIAYRTFRVATLLASLAEPGAPLACEQTAELAGLPPSAAGEGEGDARRQPPAGARFVGLPAPPSLAVAGQWGGLPFVEEILADLRRGRSQWLGVESWPPEAGTRLIDAIGECLAARGLPVRRLWMPARAQIDELARRLLGQIHDGAVGSRHGAREALLEALVEATAPGPAVLLAYGIDALDNLKSVLDEPALARLQRVPLAIVAGAMRRSGAPQTVVRLLGPRPGGSLFVRVLRMQVPAERKPTVQGMRPDVQAVLDRVSAEARAIARLATDPACSDIAGIARALGIAPDAVIARCRELEISGLLSLRDGRLEFRDELTASAVRATQV